MSTILKRLLYLITVLLLSYTLVSCGGSGGGGGGTTGTLRVGLTDAPGDYQHIFVTINEVQVHQAVEEAGPEDPGWITILTPEETYDLLELVNGTIQYLGATELEAGQYTQMRLILGTEPIEPHPHANYLVIEGDQEEEYVPGEEGEFYTIEELKVPSGPQTGIKLVSGFEIIASNTTELVLDFDANKSVVKAGNSGNWLLKPTIKVVDTIQNSLEGIVTDTSDTSPENEVSVKAQTGGVVEGSAITATDDFVGDGFYYMYLPAGTYNVVAFKEGFHPACAEVDASPIGAHIQDFDLSPADETETITGYVTDDLTVDFSIRQIITCGSGDVETELVSFSLGLDGSQEVVLPSAADPGITYQVVLSVDDVVVHDEAINLITGTAVDVQYPPPAAP